jgi:long-chain acyl-CoA synthetase
LEAGEAMALELGRGEQGGGRRGEPIVVDGCDTPQKLFLQRAGQWAGEPALREKRRGIWKTVTWAEYRERAAAVGHALVTLGVKAGEVVSVLAENRPEWLYTDFGAHCFGRIGNGVYPTSAPDQLEYILNDSGTRVLVVENDEQLDKALAVRARCPLLAKIVVIELRGLRGFADPQVMTFDALLEMGRAERAAAPRAFEDAVARTRPDDIAFLVYTSGTTGRPKGAMESNRNMMFQIAVAQEYMRMGRGDKTLSFLPLCHIAERVAGAFQPLRWGNIVHFPESTATIANDLREVVPHTVFAPPRFWEKMYSQVVLFMQEALPSARWLYARAVETGTRVADLRLARKPVPRALAWRFAVLQWLALRNIRSYLGLQSVENALTGAAPVAPELLKWYMAIGVDLLEAYGMTESSGMISATPPDRIKLGFAGRPGSGIEVKLGAENEILVRGPNVFAGYWRQPAQTAQAIDAEGWLHTGDVGEIDADGFVGIRDRLKDIIITSGGKNVTPSAIENQLKFSPYVSDAVVIGEARHYLTCLVMLDHDNVAQFAQDRQIPFTDYASLARAREVVELVGREIEAINAKLARVEQLKDFRIIDVLLTADDEELTPTMKLKRKVVQRKYATLIDSMYGASDNARAATQNLQSSSEQAFRAAPT